MTTHERRERGAPICDLDFNGTSKCEEAFSLIHLGMNQEEAHQYFATAKYGENQIIRLRIPRPNAASKILCFDVLEVYRWIKENPNANLEAGYVCQLTPNQKRQIIAQAEHLLPPSERLVQQSHYAWGEFLPETSPFEALLQVLPVRTAQSTTFCSSILRNPELIGEEITWTTLFGNNAQVQWHIRIQGPNSFPLHVHFPVKVSNGEDGNSALSRSAILEEAKEHIQPHLDSRQPLPYGAAWYVLGNFQFDQGHLPGAEVVDSQTLFFLLTDSRDVCTLLQELYPIIESITIN